MIPRSRTVIAAFFLFFSTPAAWALDIPSGASLSIPAGGSMDLACTDLNVQGSLSVTSGQINQATNVGIGGTGVVDGGTGTISVGGNWDNSGSFVAGTSTVVFQDGCSALPAQLTGNTTFYNLTLISSTGRSIVLPAGSHITVLGTLTIQGAPGVPIQLTSSSGQTAVINLGPGANVVSSNATVPPTVRIGTAVAAAPQAIPTLGEYGLAIMSLLLAAMAARQLNTFPFARRIGRKESHGG